ncbi:C6 zinc finger domain-containing protein [Fusarium circinatum]|uniref:C6 zinc finger domain-containing protein n=1 Tax=Fusarium circinatum TaxID=48490 RepID=A0A8H5T369_FUSCI|nr:C6 zinc finger domain-containing protein [Fusarium circinatum]
MRLDQIPNSGVNVARSFISSARPTGSPALKQIRTLASQVATLESRVAQLEAYLVQMRAEISATSAAASIPTLRVDSGDTAGCISPYLQQKCSDTASVSLWTCLGQHWYFKGIPINSPQGREWISSKIGESVSLNGFRLFGSPKHQFSSSSPPFKFPERQMAEAFLNSYFTSPWRLLYPVIDLVLMEETWASAYSESESAQVCLLVFMALCSRLKGSQLLGQSTLESLQTVIMLQIYHLLSGQWSAAAELHPYACRALYDLKGHIAHPPNGSDIAVDRRHRHIRNLFWLCYILDKDIAMRYGRPPCLTRDYCDLTLPHDWARLEYKYLTTVIHTAVRRCGATYTVDESLPDDLHNVYHSSSDISLEASRTTLQIFKSHIDILQEDMFGHIAIYPPVAAMALFLNLLLHPSDPRARNDLDLLAGCATLFQDMAMEDLTKDDMDCIQELNRFVSELVRLGNSAIWKAKREWKSTAGISS